MDELLILTKNSFPVIGQVAWLMGLLMQGIFWILDKIGIPNIGLSIIIFTVLVNLAMLPLTIKQQKFSKMSSIMNPEIQAIQAKYKNSKDPNAMAAMQQETSAVYAKYGVSPSGSCIQLLIQMPILLALYRVIYAIPAYVPQIKQLFYPLVNSVMGIENNALPVENIGTYLDANSLLSQLPKATATFAGQMKKIDFMYNPRMLPKGSDFISATDLNATLTNDIISSNLINSDHAVKNIEAVQNTFIDVFNRCSMQEWDLIREHFASNSDILSKIDILTMNLSNYNKFFGIDIGYSPLEQMKLQWADKSEGWIMVIAVCIIIPVLSAFTQWLNVKLAPTAQQNTQNGQEENPMMSSMKTMNYIMPLMSLFWCFTLPAGMGLYWTASSVFRCIQQVIINKYIDKLDIEKIIEANTEKYNEKLKKRGILAENISKNANIKTKNVNSFTSKLNEYAQMNEQKSESIKAATEQYNKLNKGSSGSKSLASKVNSVKQFNEKNNR